MAFLKCLLYCSMSVELMSLFETNKINIEKLTKLTVENKSSWLDIIWFIHALIKSLFAVNVGQ